MITREDVEELAGLARLRLGAAEAERLRGELQSILAYVEKLQALDTTGVEPMTHAVPLDCPLREDAAAPSLSADEALAAAPARVDDFFVVPRIIEK
ncbi:MAG TPA: Asp-tRNA(Asn)/Glu-tRNA(Gln) amidotransferase subunit GatC [Haliangiales bacterium]|nr:Asp-tRNA(Asn)/Glu-tRNA(Gln) amidotransferase subunit GatC [Haliangiales bacterium]